MTDRDPIEAATLFQHPVFQGWPKIARLNRDIIITEKLDGTNAAIGIYPETKSICDDTFPTGNLVVYAQSRTRIITPEQDNMGFASWVKENEEDLKLLGPGLHFGEWWGQKIQRGYGLRHRMFSLFNTRRWVDKPEWAAVITTLQEKGLNIGVVPVLYQGPRLQGTAIRPSFTMPDGHEVTPYVPYVDMADWCIAQLNVYGSKAVPGFMDPEGIVVFHTAAQFAFKVTCEKDEQPKGQKE